MLTLCVITNSFRHPKEYIYNLENNMSPNRKIKWTSTGKGTNITQCSFVSYPKRDDS